MLIGTGTGTGIDIDDHQAKSSRTHRHRYRRIHQNIQVTVGVLLQIEQSGTDHTDTESRKQKAESRKQKAESRQQTTDNRQLAADTNTNEHTDEQTSMHRYTNNQVTVGFLMQIDKLVQLIESPIFIHLRLQMLEPKK